MKNSRGATFIELLVVMAIIVIFSALILANWRGGEKQYALQRVANRLAQDVRRLESFALSTKEINNQVPTGGYGLYLNSSENTSYILFADFDNNRVYNPENGELIETVQLEKDIEIKQLSTSLLNIIFLPPDPEVFITPDATLAQIVFGVKTNLDSEKVVKINKLGLVYIDNQLSEVCKVCYGDADVDNYYSKNGIASCQLGYCPANYSSSAGNDCDDNNALVYPGGYGGSVCSKCQNDGTISFQSSAEDFANECDTTGCGTGYCKGDGYACGYYTSGQHNCPDGQACSPAGNCVSANTVNGASCTLSTQCLSGNCVDGYCCDTSCAGTCQACNLASHLGTCTNVPVNTDPNNDCSLSYTSCNGNYQVGPDGNCDGLGVCKTSGASNLCSTSSGVCQTGGGCSSGTCIAVNNIVAYQQVTGCGDTSACVGCNGYGSCVNIPAGTEDVWGNYPSTGVPSTICRATYPGTHYRCNGLGGCTAPTQAICNSKIAGTYCSYSCYLSNSSKYSSCIGGSSVSNCSPSPWSCSATSGFNYCNCNYYIY